MESTRLEGDEEREEEEDCRLILLVMVGKEPNVDRFPVICNQPVVVVSSR